MLYLKQCNIHTNIKQLGLGLEWLKQKKLSGPDNPDEMKMKDFNFKTSHRKSEEKRVFEKFFTAHMYGTGYRTGYSYV